MPKESDQDFNERMYCLIELQELSAWTIVQMIYINIHYTTLMDVYVWVKITNNTDFLTGNCKTLLTNIKISNNYHTRFTNIVSLGKIKRSNFK